MLRRKNQIMLNRSRILQMISIVDVLRAELYRSATIAGGSIQSITDSFSASENVHHQSVVIKSDYNKGWVTAVEE